MGWPKDYQTYKARPGVGYISVVIMAYRWFMKLEFWSSERQLGFTTVWSKWLASWTRVTIVLIHVPLRYLAVSWLFSCADRMHNWIPNVNSKKTTKCNVAFVYRTQFTCSTQQWGCDGEVTLRIRTWNMKDIFLALSKPSSVNFLGPDQLMKLEQGRIPVRRKLE